MTLLFLLVLLVFPSVLIVFEDFSALCLRVLTMEGAEVGMLEVMHLKELFTVLGETLFQDEKRDKNKIGISFEGRHLTKGCSSFFTQYLS